MIHWNAKTRQSFTLPWSTLLPERDGFGLGIFFWTLESGAIAAMDALRIMIWSQKWTWVWLQTSRTPIVDSLTKRIHREDEVMEDLDEDASFKILRHMLSCRRTLLKKHGLPLLWLNTQHGKIANNHMFLTARHLDIFSSFFDNWFGHVSSMLTIWWLIQL